MLGSVLERNSSRTRAHSCAGLGSGQEVILWITGQGLVCRSCYGEGWRLTRGTKRFPARCCYWLDLWEGEGRRGLLTAPTLVKRSLACTASGLLGYREIRLRNSCTPASRCPSSSRANPFFNCAAAPLLPPGY